MITVTSHTKKDNPEGLPSWPSSPPTAPGRPYVLTRNAGGQLARQMARLDAITDRDAIAAHEPPLRAVEEPVKSAG
jgi:hypothetical protein